MSTSTTRGSSNKGSWYKLLIDKIEKSIQERYFFEAVFVEYMIIDDRIKSLVRLAGLDPKKADGSPKMIGYLIDDLKAGKKLQTEPQWKLLDTGIPLAPAAFIKTFKKEKYPDEMIQQCTHVPRMLINAQRNTKSGKLVSKYGATDAPFLEQIQKWVDLRNHWMHAAGNDCLTIEEYEADITPLAIDGNSFVREICAITERIKRGVRKQCRAQKETVTD
ncbi:MAG: hypothetical protein ILP12_06015 [Lachnospiraceae bacterium]|nr:hypothetical protein [Lachnospiraceae bacterium]